MAWLTLRYQPTSLFSLKPARATSTVGKSLLIPTPYAIKMAFLDAGLRNGLLPDPDAFVKILRSTAVCVGVPDEACVTGTIQKIRQEPKKRTPEQPYISNIALREVVFFRGKIHIAFDSAKCPPEVEMIAPMVNYFGKRGSFVQFEYSEERPDLDNTFTQKVGEPGPIPLHCHLATLDDFGPDADFDALNSFSETPIRRGKHRTWIESTVPLGVHNVGAGFVHYRR
jgi:hypothetical protein